MLIRGTGIDLGGGVSASRGDNLIYRNGKADLRVAEATQVSAKKNYRDHASPSKGCTEGGDVRLAHDTAEVAGNGAEAAPEPCKQR